VLSLTPADSKLAIPPGDPMYQSTARATFTIDVKLISMQPHMHLRGRDFDIKATYADGADRTLLRVPAMTSLADHYFSDRADYATRGTSLDIVAHSITQPTTKYNPDPQKTVYWGDQSWEEMNIGFIEVAFPA